MTGPRNGEMRCIQTYAAGCDRKRATCRHQRAKCTAAGFLAFVYEFRIPFDSNQGERDVRTIRVRQNVSGCIRTEDGANIFCALRFYVITARKHGLNAIDAICNSLLDQPFIFAAI